MHVLYQCPLVRPLGLHNRGVTLASNLVLTSVLLFVIKSLAAISIPDEIFREIEKFSKEHRYSRSEVFVMAVKEFLEKLKPKELFNALNGGVLRARVFRRNNFERKKQGLLF